eukprot:scaffold83168_cov60-Phaeocystis_antarctica.AAC.2
MPLPTSPRSDEIWHAAQSGSTFTEAKPQAPETNRESMPLDVRHREGSLLQGVVTLPYTYKANTS